MITVELVDDQALVRAGFHALLDAEHDIQVVAQAADGESAVAQAREHRPQVVLMDIRMPKIDGLQATAQITADPELWFAQSPADVEFAKALCATCPAAQLCLAGAKERQEPWGVWGGELFERGVVVPRKRPRGRPRKNAA